MQYNGQEGVELAIKLLMNEFKITMALAGYLFKWIPISSLLLTRTQMQERERDLEGSLITSRPCFKQIIDLLMFYVYSQFLNLSRMQPIFSATSPGVAPEAK